MAQQVKDLALSLKQRFQYLARHSGLRMQCCCSYGVGCNCGSDSIPDLGISLYLWPGKKKKRRVGSNQSDWWHLVFIKRRNLGSSLVV